MAAALPPATSAAEAAGRLSSSSSSSSSLEEYFTAQVNCRRTIDNFGKYILKSIEETVSTGGFETSVTITKSNRFTDDENRRMFAHLVGSVFKAVPVGYRIRMDARHLIASIDDDDDDSDGNADHDRRRDLRYRRVRSVDEALELYRPTEYTFTFWIDWLDLV